jgi:hypothetical protein
LPALATAATGISLARWRLAQRRLDARGGQHRRICLFPRIGLRVNFRLWRRP